jgi:hypothetical protein
MRHDHGSMSLPGFDMPPSPAIEAINGALRAEFSDRARGFVLTQLRRCGREAGISGEDLVDALGAAGITPGGDGRRYGPVFARLSEEDLIERYGVGQRRKGNGTLGATIWRITAKGLKACP